MPEARIEISDELASKGFKKAMAMKAFVQITASYGQLLAIVWIFIAIADAFARANQLITYHALVLAGVCVVMSAKRYFDWSKEVAQTKGWTFDAKLDDLGVLTTHLPSGEQRLLWSEYKNYVEFDSYLQIEDQRGNFSFLPKTPELFEVIEFTKRKIPEK